jgi:peroxiredoxin
MDDRVSDSTKAVPNGAHVRTVEMVAGMLDARERYQLRLLLIASTIVLTILVIAGVVVERSARTPLVQVGQLAPEFTLPSTEGNRVSLAAQRGHPVVLAFVPSVQCDFCREQLLTLQAALPSLRARGTGVFAMSTDTPAVQRIAVNDLALDYPILSEAPIVEQHPVGSAYGVYHLPQRHPGPVDANAIVAVDATGIVRAVRVQIGQSMIAAEIRDLVSAGLGPKGGG